MGCQVKKIKDKKVKAKTLISPERKEFLRLNKKYFSLFLKSFQLLKIISDLRVHLQARGQ